MSQMHDWKKAFTAAQDVITDNLAHVKKTELWLVGGAVMGSNKPQAPITLNAKLTFSDDGTEKLRYDIPEELWEELDTPKATFGWVVEYVINHLILPQYFAKFN